ncbi:glycosyltransferase [Agarilytica rhodophyticola]|uniref:glycosyltransferase n=1 Tax=Agarilytica rhodophyticola TaxID=1737490 RepID=UPI000B34951B|nr:glycosyltransferase [Agarilytica rhodophyticola]
MRDVTIITTACLPWFTGTSINPMIKASELSKNNICVKLMVPWLSLEDQKKIYSVQFNSQKEQLDYINSYLDEHNYSRMDIIFYDGAYIPWYGIVPSEKFLDKVPVNNYLILEEIDHLLINKPFAKFLRARPDLRIMGVIHTNYPYYWRKYFRFLPDFLYKFMIKNIYGVLHYAILKRNAHRLVALSPAIDFYRGISYQCLHGVGDEFFHEDSVENMSDVYFIGKIIKEKSIDSFIDVANALPDVKFDLWGKFFDTYADKFTGNITHRGETAEPSKSLKSYKIFFNPSQSEVLCTTTLEAIAMKKIVILPDVPCNQVFKLYKRAYFYNNLQQAIDLVRKMSASSSLPEVNTEGYRWSNVIKQFISQELVA